MKIKGMFLALLLSVTAMILPTAALANEEQPSIKYKDGVVSVLNPENIQDGNILIGAQYDDTGRLVKVKFYNAKDKESIPVSGDFNMGAPVKFMLWNDFENIKPGVEAEAVVMDEYGIGASETLKPTATPNPTETLEPTATPNPTETLEPTETPNPSETLEPSETPEPTETPNPTETLEPTETPNPTATLEPSETPNPTETLEPTETPNPSETLEPSETPNPSETPEPTETLEPTETPNPSETPEPTETPKPTETPEPTQTPEPIQVPSILKDGEKYAWIMGKTYEEAGKSYIKLFTQDNKAESPAFADTVEFWAPSAERSESLTAETVGERINALIDDNGFLKSTPYFSSSGQSSVYIRLIKYTSDDTGNITKLYCASDASVVSDPDSLKFDPTSFTKVPSGGNAVNGYMIGGGVVEFNVPDSADKMSDPDNFSVAEADPSNYVVKESGSSRNFVVGEFANPVLPTVIVNFMNITDEPASFTEMNSAGFGPEIMIVDSVELLSKDTDGRPVYKISGCKGEYNVSVTTNKNTNVGQLAEGIWTQSNTGRNYNAESLWTAKDNGDVDLDGIISKGDTILYTNDGRLIARHIDVDVLQDYYDLMYEQEIPVGSPPNPFGFYPNNSSSRVGYYVGLPYDIGLTHKCARIELENPYGGYKTITIPQNEFINLVEINKTTREVNIVKKKLSYENLISDDILYASTANGLLMTDYTTIYRFTDEFNTDHTRSFDEPQLLNKLQKGEKYGWIMNVYNSMDGENTLLKLYTQDNEVKELPLASRLYIWAPGETYGSWESPDIVKQIHSEDKYLKTYPYSIRLVKYSTNSNGEINNLYYAVDPNRVTDEDALGVVPLDLKGIPCVFGGVNGYWINDGITEFNVPSNTADMGNKSNYSVKQALYDNYSITQTGSSRDFVAAELVNGIDATVVINFTAPASEPASFTEMSSTGAGPSAMIVDSIDYDGMDDDGNELYTFNGYHGGSPVSYSTTPKSNFGKIRSNFWTYSNSRRNFDVDTSDKNMADNFDEGDLLLYTDDGRLTAQYIDASALSEYVQTGDKSVFGGYNPLGNHINQYTSRVGYYFGRIVDIDPYFAWIKLDCMDTPIILDRAKHIDMVELDGRRTRVNTSADFRVFDLELGDYVYVSTANSGDINDVAAYRAEDSAVELPDVTPMPSGPDIAPTPQPSEVTFKASDVYRYSVPDLFGKRYLRVTNNGLNLYTLNIVDDDSEYGGRFDGRYYLNGTDVTEQYDFFEFIEEFIYNNPEGAVTLKAEGTENGEYNRITVTYQKPAEVTFKAADFAELYDWNYGYESYGEAGRFYVFVNGTSEVSYYKLAAENGAFTGKCYVNGVDVTGVYDFDSFVDRFIGNNPVGEVTLKSEDPANASVMPRVYDTIMVTYYKDAVVKSVESDGTDTTIYFSAQQDGLDDSLVIGENADYSIEKSGAKINAADLKPYDIVSVAYDVTSSFAYSTFYDMIVSDREPWVGKAGTMRTTIDGTEYQLDGTYYPAVEELVGYWLDIYTTYTWYFDGFGRIAYAEEMPEYANIAILDNIYKSTDRETWVAKLIYKDGTSGTVNLGSKIDDDANVLKMAKFVYSNVYRVEAGGVVFSESALKYEPEERVIQYRINSSGELTSIRYYTNDRQAMLENGYSSDDIAGVYSTAQYIYIEDTGNIGPYSISDKTPMVGMREAADGWDISAIGKHDLIDGNEYTAYFYERANNGLYGFVIISGDSLPEPAEPPIVSEETVILDNIYTSTDGETIYASFITGDGDGNRFPLSAKLSSGESISELESYIFVDGDRSSGRRAPQERVVKCGINSNGEVSEITSLTPVTERGIYSASLHTIGSSAISDNAAIVIIAAAGYQWEFIRLDESVLLDEDEYTAYFYNKAADGSYEYVLIEDNPVGWSRHNRMAVYLDTELTSDDYYEYALKLYDSSSDEVVSVNVSEGYSDSSNIPEEFRISVDAIINSGINPGTPIIYTTDFKGAITSARTVFSRDWDDLIGGSFDTLKKLILNCPDLSQMIDTSFTNEEGVTDPNKMYKLIFGLITENADNSVEFVTDLKNAQYDGNEYLTADTVNDAEAYDITDDTTIYAYDYNGSLQNNTLVRKGTKSDIVATAFTDASWLDSGRTVADVGAIEKPRYAAARIVGNDIMEIMVFVPENE